MHARGPTPAEGLASCLRCRRAVWFVPGDEWRADAMWNPSLPERRALWVLLPGLGFAPLGLSYPRPHECPPGPGPADDR